MNLPGQGEKELTEEGFEGDLWGDKNVPCFE